MDVLSSAWNNAPYKSDDALSLNTKFKCLWSALMKWSRNISQLNNTISNCNYTLAMMDGIENQRRLTTMENNFRTILKAHTSKLLEAKRIYWKNRAKIRWINLGDENSKFFHTIATQSYRKNYITSLKTDDNSYVTNHDHKAAIIWNSYKERLGVSN
jgi:hypothetical protein